MQLVKAPTPHALCPVTPGSKLSTRNTSCSLVNAHTSWLVTAKTTRSPSSPPSILIVNPTRAHPAIDLCRFTSVLTSKWSYRVVVWRLVTLQCLYHTRWRVSTFDGEVTSVYLGLVKDISGDMWTPMDIVFRPWSFIKKYIARSFGILDLVLLNDWWNLVEI